MSRRVHTSRSAVVRSSAPPFLLTCSLRCILAFILESFLAALKALQQQVLGLSSATRFDACESVRCRRSPPPSMRRSTSPSSSDSDSSLEILQESELSPQSAAEVIANRRDKGKGRARDDELDDGAAESALNDERIRSRPRSVSSRPRPGQDDPTGEPSRGTPSTSQRRRRSRTGSVSSNDSDTDADHSATKRRRNVIVPLETQASLNQTPLDHYEDDAAAQLLARKEAAKQRRRDAKEEKEAEVRLAQAGAF